MPNYQAVTKDCHGQRRWQRFVNYSFARDYAVAPLVMAELSKAVMALPIGFLPQGDRFRPFALLGFQAGRNLCLTQDGRWIGEYVPAYFRAYPFILANAESGEKVLCVDESSGLVVDGGEGEEFFGANGEPSAALMEVFNFLHQTDLTSIPTQAACDLLQQHELIVPWPITIQGEDGERKLEGVFRIDEPRLNGLTDEAFIELRQYGALLLAHCQLLSMQHLQNLGKLARAHAELESQNSLGALAPGGEIDLEFLKKNETINFGGFR